jgi:biopolymer transport protein ExbD
MLLLFFVVSTTFNKGVNKLNVALPEAQAQSFKPESKQFEIGVDASGNYYLNGKSLETNQPQRLKAKLADVMKANKENAVILIGDKAAPHQAVVSALAVSNELGITQIQILAKSNQLNQSKK